MDVSTPTGAIATSPVSSHESENGADSFIDVEVTGVTQTDMKNQMPTDIDSANAPISDSALAVSLPSRISDIDKASTNLLSSTASVAEAENLKPEPKPMPTPKRTPKPRQASSSKLSVAKVPKDEEGGIKKAEGSSDEAVAEAGADASGTIV